MIFSMQIVCPQQFVGNRDGVLCPKQSLTVNDVDKIAKSTLFLKRILLFSAAGRKRYVLALTQIQRSLLQSDSSKVCWLCFRVCSSHDDSNRITILEFRFEFFHDYYSSNKVFNFQLVMRYSLTAFRQMTEVFYELKEAPSFQHFC